MHRKPAAARGSCRECAPESGIVGVKQFQAGSTDPALGSRWESGRLEGVSEELWGGAHKPVEKVGGEGT